MRTRDQELSDFLYGGAPTRRDIPPATSGFSRKLQMMKAARELRDLKSPPGNRLELLQGDLKGHWSIRVSKQWRLVFIWDAVNKEATDVYFDDYH